MEASVRRTTRWGGQCGLRQANGAPPIHLSTSKPLSTVPRWLELDLPVRLAVYRNHQTINPNHEMSADDLTRRVFICAVLKSGLRRGRAKRPCS